MSKKSRFNCLSLDIYCLSCICVGETGRKKKNTKEKPNPGKKKNCEKAHFFAITLEIKRLSRNCTSSLEQ